MAGIWQLPSRSCPTRKCQVSILCAAVNLPGDTNVVVIIVVCGEATKECEEKGRKTGLRNMGCANSVGSLDVRVLDVLLLASRPPSTQPKQRNKQTDGDKQRRAFWHDKMTN